MFQHLCVMRVRWNLTNAATQCLVFLSAVVLHCVVAQSGLDQNLIVGVIMPYNQSDLEGTMGYRRTAGALNVAWNRVKSEGILPRASISYQFFFGDCDEMDAAGQTISIIRNSTLDVVLGPPCSSAAVMAGLIANFYDFPVYVWSNILTSDLYDVKRFPTVVSVAINTYSFVTAAASILTFFGWEEFAFVYSLRRNSAIAQCSFFQSDIDVFIASAANPNLTLTYKRDITTGLSNTTVLTRNLNSLKNQARIIVGCFESVDDYRTFAQSVMENDMATDEYVYILLLTQSRGYNPNGKYLWEGTDGKDAQIHKAFKNIFVIDVQNPNSSYQTFNNDVLQAMHNAPFYCDKTGDCPDGNVNSSVQATFLADALYIYATAVNRTIEADGVDSIRNGTLLVDHSRGNFSGYSGDILLNSNGERTPVFEYYGLDTNGLPKKLFVIQEVDGIIKLIPSFSNEANEVWMNYNNVRPGWKPKCGFTGSDCPDPFMQDNYGYVIGGVLGIALVVAFFLLIACYMYRSKQEQAANLDKLWRIDSIDLIKPTEKNEAMKSMRSIQSGVSSTSTRFTMDSKRDTTNHTFLYYNGEPVVARKQKSAPKLETRDHLELRNMSTLDHDNLCRFVGVCLNNSPFLSVWKYCGRRSLMDAIEKSTVQMDSFFMLSLIRDVVEGLGAIHTSSFQQHGYLTSKCCLIDDRWQVKISDYGLNMFKRSELRNSQSLIWCAPEILRENDLIGTAKGDIYSLAIIASEVISQKPPWNLGESEMDADEVVYRVKKHSASPFRPELIVDGNIEVNPSLLVLIRDCWSEEPEDRPKIPVVKNVLKAMHNSRNGNLMDHVFSILETYATNLEQEVESRTRQLAEEKKKADILLYRMLPRSVADKLKLGQSVEPEGYDSVTIFFSDVVSFTTLASRCTPLQVVNLLNDLYTTFDTIIDEHSCYKVETIGDAYLCASGLPNRNGNMHARDIAEMSFGFLRSLRTFRVPHLPTEKVNIRIGLHTGPCVAGVVGLTMPRYCLFGDSVNTASRMESNSKPGRIHISSETNHYLTNIIGGYQTESRGEVLIKGKGVMETYFLLTAEELENQ